MGFLSRAEIFSLVLALFCWKYCPEFVINQAMTLLVLDWAIQLYSLNVQAGRLDCYSQTAVDIVSLVSKYCVKFDLEYQCQEIQTAEVVQS